MLDMSSDNNNNNNNNNSSNSNNNNTSNNYDLTVFTHQNVRISDVTKMKDLKT